MLRPKKHICWREQILIFGQVSECGEIGEVGEVKCCDVESIVSC